nr:NADH dehydrogenase subunit 2 [Scleropages jardinii]
MSPYLPAILLSSLGMGTLLTFASSHWLLAWMGLEISTIAILPLMTQQHHPRAIEAATKYFLTQATAAAVILFASTANAWALGDWNISQTSHPLAVTIILLALALKIGLAPMHLWLPEVLQGLDLTTGLILSTWQKLAPFALIYQIAPHTNPTLLISLGVLSALVGGWGGLNQTQLRKLMAFSTIGHWGWVIIILHFSPSLALLNVVIYIAMTTAMFLSLKGMAATKINSLAMAWPKAPILTLLAMLCLLSLGGLPPLTGFMPKWLILQELMKQDLTVVAAAMAMSALLSLFFYLRLCYAMALTISPNTANTAAPWRLKSTLMILPLAATIILALMLLPITPTTVALLS